MTTYRGIFSVFPCDPKMGRFPGYHRPTREEDNLERLFARRATRKLSKSLSFQYEGVLYQLEPTFPNRFRATHVNILKRIGKPILIESGGREHPYSIWEMAPYSKPKVLDSKQPLAGARDPPMGGSSCCY